ncbi:sigma-54-dependent transcriptional regulator [Pontibacter lucknowensis]|uniref:DNA-binding transcriptional response regulator, NtrC family, contains REC, AAA-type ATPase, and a Fis-type DNA-binding domains n=1 Tax=Pontibacter lucknowensis TaxID=1077936 RepID=A0A1N6X978_9BACT|nr:sigma-54 dependent transcriptional regulator [Pontibacter lucknowensis]SIQ98827.1 DNA-binding transcriptional response regulator, NtrC family, contains REC, AAA-type ATPase, and a Fis-type DNA-binding domains [Pontibacter lucknowensis]
MEQNLGRILVIDDNEDVLFSAKMLLRKYAKEVVMEKNPKKIPFLVSNEEFDIILLDMNFSQDITSGQEGFFWLKEILKYDPSAVVVMITAFGDVEMAVRALKEGATDFVLKPWQNEKLLATLTAASKLRHSYKEVNQLRQVNRTLTAELQNQQPVITGESQAMRSLFSIIDKVARTDADILLLGENGTGKEVIARTIHQRSSRADKVFVTVDMGAITETLFESELFGHKKGAFTDAKEDRVGRFEAANGGTLFLDEIGNLSPALQSKLLTVLQRREIIRVGTNKPIPIDVRLICATNMPLKEMVQRHEFRQDLLYRINTVELNLPPLRERLEDIPLFADHYLQTYATKYKQPLKRLSDAALAKLRRYTWPGNVRELQHVLERASIMSDNRELQPDDFFFIPDEPAVSATAPAVFSNSQNLEDLEREAVQRAMQLHEGNVSKAAKELGLSRGALYRRLEKYAL